MCATINPKLVTMTEEKVEAKQLLSAESEVARPAKYSERKPNVRILRKKLETQEK